MTTLTINGISVEVEPGTLILDAAAQAGFDIPTLCYLPGQKHISSCMVCCVKDLQNGGLTPACTAKVSEGMEIDTESDDVREMRKNSLELLLTEHIGDCEAPCRLACPAGMDVPAMLRHIQNGNTAAALSVANKHLAMPATLGYVCEAPCEKACRRGRHDTTVSIKQEHRFIAEHEGFQNTHNPDSESKTDKSVAIIGAGIAGLTAAYFLSDLGYSCTIFEAGSEAGGYLRAHVNLPKSVLDAEINGIITGNVSIKTGAAVNNALTELISDFDAVIIASGDNTALSKQFACDAKGIKVDTLYQTSVDKVFAIGGSIKKGGKIIHAAADGRKVAMPVDTFIRNQNPSKETLLFNSRMGALKGDELNEFMKCASDIPQVNLTESTDLAEAISEAKRCMRCDCRKPETCKLRIYSQEYGADQKYFGTGNRNAVTIEHGHSEICFEPGKCITCGICIQICEQADETLGMSYTGRGYDLTVTVPFDEMVANGMKKETALECAKMCPTAAISLKDK